MKRSPVALSLLAVSLMVTCEVSVAQTPAQAHDASPETPAAFMGLALVPDGTVLVADYASGVLTKDRVQVLALPHVTSIAPIDASSMWATATGTDPYRDTGQGLYLISNGDARLVQNLFEIESELNPDDEQPFDSNPFDVAALGDDAALVIDSGGNVLYRMDESGAVEVIATFPNGKPEDPSMKGPQSVPTSIAVGPDGSYYVGELIGAPAPRGVSSIWKVAPEARDAACGASPSCVKVFDGGFTSIIDLAFGPDGTLYVAELDENSWLAVESDEIEMAGGTVTACDLSTSSPVCTELATGIPMLTAIAVDPSGTVWAVRSGLDPAAEVISLPQAKR